MYRKILGILLLVATATICHAQERREVRLPDKPNRNAYADYSQKEQGFWCSPEVNVATTAVIDRKNLQTIGLTYTAGYRFNEFLRVGAGVGFRAVVNNNDVRKHDDVWSFPLYVHARGNMISQTDRSCVPFWSYSVGAALRDGFYMKPTVGLRFGESRSAWLVTLGYEVNVMETSHKPDEAYSGVTLGLGYEF